MRSGLRSRRLAIVLVAAVIGSGVLLVGGAAATVPSSQCVQRTESQLGQKLCLAGVRVVRRNSAHTYVLSVANTGTETIPRLFLQLRPGSTVTVKSASSQYTSAGGWDTWSYPDVAPGQVRQVTLKLAFGPRTPGHPNWEVEDQTRPALDAHTFLFQGVFFAPKKK